MNHTVQIEVFWIIQGIQYVWNRCKCAPKNKEKNVFDLILVCFLNWSHSIVRAVIFETGAMPTPTKSKILTICGWGGRFYSNLTHS